MPQLKKIVTANSDLNRVQDAIKTAYDELVSMPFKNTQTISVPFVAPATDTTVFHALGRVPEGFVVVDNTAAAVIYRNGDATGKTITLRASAATVAKIVLY